MRRRTLLTNAARLVALAPASSAAPLLGVQALQPLPPRSTGDRLDQGPFDIDQDQGWFTVLFTTPSEQPQRNPGLGLVGYTWEESGPSLAARAGRETLERHVENISSPAFRRRALHPLRLAACAVPAGRTRPPSGLGSDPRCRPASRPPRGVPGAFPTPNRSPINWRSRSSCARASPLVTIGRIPQRGATEYVEPRYDHPDFSEGVCRAERSARRTI